MSSVEVKNNSILSPQAISILEKRYLRRNEHGKIMETPEELFRRVAKAIAQAEKEEVKQEWENKFFDLMWSLKFLPNSPTLVNAGTDKGCLSACFVSSPETDTMESIMQTVYDWAMIEKWGGGVGIGLGVLRPKGDKISSTHGKALGPLAVMDMLSNNANHITQGAFRLGAHMAQMPCSHPNILDFIHCKDNDDKLSNFNISVQITDDFMKAVEEDKDWYFINPRNNQKDGKIKARKLWGDICESAWKTGDPGVVFMDRVSETTPNPQLGEIVTSNPCWSGDTKIWTIFGPQIIRDLVGQEVSVLSKDENNKMVFRMMRNIRQTGLERKTLKIFIESKENRIRSEIILTPNHNLYLKNGEKIEAKDLKIGSGLASINTNVNNIVVDIQEGPLIDVYNGTVDDTHNYYVWLNDKEGILSANCSEEFLENNGNCCLGSIDISKYVVDRTIDWNSLGESIHTAVRFLDNVIEVNKFPLQKLRDVNLKTRRIGLGIMGLADLLVKLEIPYDSKKSFDLAERLGKFLKDKAWIASGKLAEERGVFPEYEKSRVKDWVTFPVRHSSVITIAPTGTISRLAGCSSGLEPHFALAWWSNILWEDQEGKNTKFLDCPISIRERLEKDLGAEKAESLLERIADTPLKAADMLRETGIDISLYKTANIISYENHIKMQAMWQKNVTNGISKTINMPNSATMEDVEKAFLLAWKLGCKAVTAYRDGSKSMQVLETGITKIDKKASSWSRPKAMKGITEKVITGHGSAYVTINFDEENKPIEVFTNLGKAGACDSANLEAISRLVSLALRSGIDTKEIIEQIKNITCCPVFDDGKSVKSPVDGISKVIIKYVLKPEMKAKKEMMKEIDVNKEPYSNGYKCSSCGGDFVYIEGCRQCQECGLSKCD